MNGGDFLRSLRPGQLRSDDAEDIRQELEHYLELRAEELMRDGMQPDEARRVARQRFGDTETIEAELRRQARRRRARKGTTMTIAGIRQDVAYAFRTLRRSPGFTVVAVVTLGLALGGTTAIFSVVDAALLSALPFEDHEQLVFVNGYHLADGEIAIRGASFPEFRDWDERARGIEPMAAVDGRVVAVTGDEQAESVSAAVVTRDFFRVLGVEPQRGRAFSAEEHGRAEGASVVTISHGLWERRYGMDAAALGSTLVVDGQPFTIVGIMPQGFGGIGLSTEVWMPEAALVPLDGGGDLDARGNRFLGVVGRLTTDVDQAQQELDVIAGDLQVEHPGAHRDRFAQVQSFREAYLGQTGETLWLLLGSGAVLLLIAAANVTNLLLVRAHGRSREIVLRQALGAARSRVAGQLLTESVVLAALGGALGLLMAVAAMRILGPMIPAGVLPGYVALELSASTFAFSLLALGLVGVLMGATPAAAGMRVGLASTLREGGRTGRSSRGRARAQQAFVVTQVALALVLTSGAGLLTRSVQARLAVDTGTEIERLAAARMALPSSRYADAETRRILGAELQRLAAEIPGVRSASVSSDLPFRGGSSGAYVYRLDTPDERIRYHRHSVSPEYFETLGIRAVAGRLLDERDTPDGPRVGVVTESMVARVFPEEDPVGRSMYLGSDARFPFEIVGVIEDLRYRDLTTSLFAEGNSPDIFFPFVQAPSTRIELAVSVDGDPAAFVGPLREVVREADSDLPVFDLAPVMAGYRAQTATPRFAAYLMSLFSGLALLLACVGIYGVLAFSVSQRGAEIAIRRAVGATARTVASAVVRDGLELSALGLVIGGVIALSGGRVLESLLFDVESTDPVTFAAVGVGLLMVALGAAAVPAVRAARRDPAEALAGE